MRTMAGCTAGASFSAALLDIEMKRKAIDDQVEIPFTCDMWNKFKISLETYFNNWV